MYDLVIIGSGPAGLTAAIYSARYTLNTLVIGGSPGGQVAESGRVENYPGFKRISGLDLTKRILDQVNAFGVPVKRGEVSKIEKNISEFRVLANGDEYRSTAVLLALGVKPRKLGVPGEERLLGKGVSYCALCDAPIFTGDTVAMVGGGDSALDGALELSEHAEKIYVINRSNNFSAKPDFVRRAKENEKITMITERNVTEVAGQSRVESVKLDKAWQGKKELAVDGFFVEIGYVPDRSLPESLGLDLDETGYIVVSVEMETNKEGVFAAGDVTTKSAGMKQIVCACSEGAIAARSVYRYLNNKNFVEDDIKEKGGVAMADKKPVVDQEKCIGCGLCVSTASGTFEFSDSGKAEVIDSHGDSEDDIQEAIDSCPVDAISWE